jgi:hypothetical protein
MGGVSFAVAGIVVAAVAALAAGGTGCSGANCTEVGCGPGASVELRGLPREKARGAAARLCVDGTCRRFGLGGRDYLDVEVPDLGPRERVRVSVTVRTPRGVVLSRAEGWFATRTSRPNGPDCRPTCHSIALRFDARDGTLTRHLAG